MQLIWVSGATSKVQKFNITPKGLMKIGLAIGTFFVFCGIGIHFIGFKMALQVRPDLARAMGGVVTFEELDALDVAYKEELERLQAQLTKSIEKISELKTLKDRFADVATPCPSEK